MTSLGLPLVVSWLVARANFGGELVGGETSWWRDDRIPSLIERPSRELLNPIYLFIYFPYQSSY